VCLGSLRTTDEKWSGCVLQMSKALCRGSICLGGGSPPYRRERMSALGSSQTQIVRQLWQRRKDAALVYRKASKPDHTAYATDTGCLHDDGQPPYLVASSNSVSTWRYVAPTARLMPSSHVRLHEAWASAAYARTSAA
jgi:hypothetical protein